MQSPISETPSERFASQTMDDRCVRIVCAPADRKLLEIRNKPDRMDGRVAWKMLRALYERGYRFDSGQVLTKSERFRTLYNVTIPEDDRARHPVTLKVIMETASELGHPRIIDLGDKEILIQLRP